MEYLASPQRSCPERWHWPCSWPGHWWVALAVVGWVHGQGLRELPAQGVGGKLPLQQGQAQPYTGTEEFQDTRVWALQPPGAAQFTLCNVSRGDRIPLVGEHHVICKILRWILALDSQALCHAKPRHRSQWKHSFRPFPFPLSKDQILIRASRLFAETKGNY